MSHSREERIRKLEQQLAEAQSQKLPTVIADLLNDLGWELRKVDGKRALEVSRKAHELSEKIVYHNGLACSLRNEGYVRMLQSENQEALTSSLEALRLYELINDSAGQATALNTIGNVYHSLGDYENALRNHMKSLQIKETLQDKKGQAASLNNLGTVYQRLNDTSRALECYLKSLKIREDIGDHSGEGGPLNNIGLIYQELGEYEKALEFYFKGLDYETASDGAHAILLMNIGNAYFRLGNLNQAADYLKRSLKVSQDSGDREAAATCLVNLGELKEAAGDDEGADKFYKECLELTRSIGSKFLEGTALYDIGKVCLKQNRLKDAMTYFEEAHEIASEIQSRELVYSCELGLADACEKMGELAAALQHYKGYHQSKEQLTTLEADRKTRALMIQYEVENAHKEKEIFRLKNVELAEAYQEKERLLRELTKTNEELHNQTRVDSLTHVGNRRFVDQELPNEFDRARRFGRQLSVVMADIDHFKLINDRFTHQVGDQVLRIVAEIIRSSCRSVDGVSRYGGEEFLLYFPETNGIGAVIVCEKIRKAIEDYDWRTIAPGLRVTISMGISDDLNLSTYEKLISAADAKLYEAKSNGRNCICR
jgi:diguanylate cyclase (GGDEF)-like protein